MKQHIWTKKAGFLTIIMALLLLPQALGMDCFIDLDPFVRGTSTPAALCILNDEQNDYCVTWLSNPVNGSEQWGFQPERKYIDGVGAIDYYEVLGTTVTVEFNKERLYDNQTVTGNMRCGNETYSFNFTPHFLDYEELAEGTLWVKQNTPYLIGALLLIFVILAFITWMVRNA